MFYIRNFEGDKNEFEFFLDMLYESIHIVENKPSKEVLLNAPGIRKYHEGWGRKGDKVLIAVDAENKTVGAVWYRLFNNNNKSYGYIDGNTPEIGMAVLKEVRGRGVGTLLMHKIIQQAKDEGYNTISLSVDLENDTAINMYQN
ncbi:Acetyltransferase (GNAT) family protein [Lysinibacillus sp. AC-3]|uniref:GNAT family N-acetyltransferase n=1 Tax=unclassified Lysinibacillus TaxID=2636778 RepID=UPI0009D343A5|nr:MULTISPECIES: GNAT family N-acetyltransferase [unclassified Lysinibacillus]SKC18771.1 Acetyltransferase (GNAT) family protein [Lysinibacillus sp. AC-3]